MRRSCSYATTVVINLSSRQIRSADYEAEGTMIWTADEVRQAFSLRRLFGSFGAFAASEILVDDRRALLSIKPQIAARLLSRGKCGLRDPSGLQDLRWRDLLRLAYRALRDASALPAARRKLEARIAALARPPAVRPRLGDGPPLVLRADLWFGISAGGSVSHIASILKAMQSVGWKPVLATPDAVPSIPAEISVLPITPHERQLFRSEWRQLLFNLDLVPQIMAAWSHPPPRFVYQRHGLNVFAGLDLARLWQVPYILEYNGPELWVAQHWGQPIAKPDLCARIEQLALRGADLVAVVSEPLAKIAAEHGVPAHHILVLPNGVDTALFHPDRDPSEMRRRYGLADRLVIGFIGTFGPWHGVEVLAEAFALLLARKPELGDRVSLLLVGDGARLAAVRDIIDQHGIGTKVALTSLLPQASGPDAVAAFDIAVAPTVPNPDGSPFFGSPTKIFEYMASGKASICSALGQVTSLIEHERNGLLVPPGNVEALADAIARLVEDAALRDQLGKAARGDAVALHSVEHRGREIAAACQAWEGQKKALCRIGAQADG